MDWVQPFQEVKEVWWHAVAKIVLGAYAVYVAYSDK
jgi:hypothetical protein